MDYDPSQRAGHTQDWPCGCEIESERGHIRPCPSHEHIAGDAQLLAFLESAFPDLEPLDDGAQDVGNRLTPTPLDRMEILPEMRVFDPNEDGAD